MRSFGAAAALLCYSTLASAAGGFPYDFYGTDRKCASHVVTDLTSSEFGAVFNEQVGKDLMLVDYDMRVDVYGQTLVSGVYKENFDRTGWVARRGMSTTSFAVEEASQRSHGYRMIDLEHYQDGSSWRVAAIWVQNKGRAYHYQLSVSETEYLEKFNEWKDEYVLVDIDMYEKEGSLRYNTVWCQKKSGDDYQWEVVADVSRSEYNSKVEEYSGFIVTDFESARIHGEQRNSAIFYNSTRAKIGSYRWQTNLSKRRLAQLLDEHTDRGKRVVEIESYNDGNSVFYGATWWENDFSKTRWHKKDKVDSIVEGYVWGEDGIPGMSVTVVKDGVEKYSRGFKNSEVERGSSISVTTRTIYRLASVSMGIGAVLASLLEQEGKINLDAKAQPLIDESPSVTLPSSHTYTVRQTMTHRSGIRHYIPDDNVWDDSNPTYTTAASALPMLPASQALVNSVGTYLYSTHAYTFAAAALEGATGKSITTLVREYLRDRQGVSSLAAEHEAATRDRRARMYTSDGTRMEERDNLSWKVLGGGLEASSRDLGVFFDRLQRGKILTSSNLAAMFNVPDDKSSYGTGFAKATINGAQVYTKSGDQVGASSCVVMVPSKGYSIVVLSNQKNGLADDVAEDIARTLW